MAKLHILLIEDNRLLREGIVSMLQGQGNFLVVAQAEDANVIQMVEDLVTPPHVVLLDLGLAKVNSLKLMVELRDKMPDAKIIAMDIVVDNVDLMEFVRAGGDGFILKNASPMDYIQTIQDVGNGIKVLPSVLTKGLFDQIVDSVLSNGKLIPDSMIKMTVREREIVNLISEGLSNKEIASKLHIATYTVKSHVHNILEKLDLTTRLQVAAYARTDKPA